ncbi:Hypothetical_protein [Hexamita inflata]|uniref:Hypothetical_protein n=1 Tax=Hexamita inflata TaxID=28002 RepID=A0AA86P630_9EUKA|nr:Hypothetical protein HINF_LOCUS19193 [Hexamita inflata]
MSQALVQCRDKHIYFSKGAVAHALVVSVLQIVIVRYGRIAVTCQAAGLFQLRFYLGRLNLSHIFTSIMQSQNTESPTKSAQIDLESCGQPCTQSTSVCTPAAFYAAQLFVVRFCSICRE